jgi:hypothetical protein
MLLCTFQVPSSWCLYGDLELNIVYFSLLVPENVVSSVGLRLAGLFVFPTRDGPPPQATVRFLTSSMSPMT